MAPKRWRSSARAVGRPTTLSRLAIATITSLGPRGDRGSAQFSAIDGSLQRRQIRRLNCVNSDLPWSRDCVSPHLQRRGRRFAPVTAHKTK